jgi:hypothetical protein
MFKELDDREHAEKSFKKAMRIFKKIGAKGWLEKIKG